MITRSEIISNKTFLDSDLEVYSSLIGGNFVIFDIETTGFSPNNTFLYLIGAIYLNEDKLTLTQWFCENPSDELIVLDTFCKFLNTFEAIITYNGDGFDIPYLQAKCRQFNISFNFNEFKSIDILKYVRQVSALLKIENLKQKTVEKFLGIKRDDTYNGGELIKVYQKYVVAPSDDALNTLLLHNSDDVKCLLKLLDITSYAQIKNSNYKVKDITTQETKTGNKEAIFTCELENCVPLNVSFGCGDFYLTCYGSTLKLKCNFYVGVLKYFYKNFADYYYLPEEDIAIHKSVASYVDKRFRTKAKASNCYSKKEGVFLPQFTEVISPIFKIDFSDKMLFFEFDDIFQNTSTLQEKYVNHIINSIL